MTTQPTQFLQTHIAMVLDRSGSMETCRKATIDAVNKYLLEARGDAALKEADFELMTFDTQSIDTVRTGAPINVKDISLEDYVPRGGTPLFDAIGRGIDGLDGKIAKDGSGKAILVIVTDGQENASRKYTAPAIKELVKARQDAGWLVVFLGAGLDAAQQGAALGVRGSYTANIAMDAASFNETMAEVACASAGYGRAPTAEKARAFASSTSFSADSRKRMGDASGGADLAKAFKTDGNGNLATLKRGDPVQQLNKSDTWAKKPGDAWGA
jgi:uncharacterized protein YegL